MGRKGRGTGASDNTAQSGTPFIRFEAQLVQPIQTLIQYFRSSLFNASPVISANENGSRPEVKNLSNFAALILRV